MDKLGRSLIVMVAVLSGGAVLPGCSRPGSNEDAEPRRELLKPAKREQREAELAERAKVVNAEGELLPSDQVAAGLQLPRGGLELLNEQPHRWVYHASGASFEALDRYFAKRLFTGRIDRVSANMVTYVDADIKNASNQPKISLRLLRTTGRETEILIEQAMPRPRTLSYEEADALTRSNARKVQR